MPEKLFGWVTAALDDESSLQALVLAKSLRRSITKAQIVVLTTHHVSESIVDALAEDFDVVVNINAELDPTHGLSALDYAKLFCWSLTSYSKCIFVNSDMMMLKNCDELFDRPHITALQHLNKPGNFDSSLFVIEPSYKEYKNISKLLESSTYLSGNDYLNEYFSNWQNEDKKYQIDSDFCIRITTDPVLAKIPDTAKIAHFSGVRLWTKISNAEWPDNLAENYRQLCNLWLEIFMDEVVRELAPEIALNLGINCNFENTPSKPVEISKEDHESLKDAIAIIGHSCRFPGANNVEEFWELLKTGGDGITSIPLERLNEVELQDPLLTSLLAGYLKCPIDEFDAKFFGISPREAAYMDPQQRLLVEVAWEALENAAINPASLKGSNTAVYSGVWTHDYERVVTEKPSAHDFHHVILGNAFSATSARVSYFLGLNGPNIVTESGCSSSMVSLHLACKSLRRGETNLAIAGGVNLLVAKFPYSEVPILAKDGHCKTFDESGDGFARAEGVGVVILKRYTDAIQDGDRIMAIIRGSAVSNEGTTSSFGTPSKYCQELAIKDAIKDANINPNRVDYVEAHGTGTPVGDPIEFAAIASGYAGQRENPLIVGSVKTNIGHTESAAGLAGLIKVIMSMKNEVIPPHVNFKTLNPNINLEVLPAIIPVSAIEWPKNSTRRRIAGISSFGISGTNVHVIVEEPPMIHKSKISDTKVDRQHQILTLSAKNESALKDLIAKYVHFFEENASVNLPDLAYTANTGRAHFKYRVAVTGKNVEEIKTSLSKQTPNGPKNEKPVVAFLFTGQGSQYPGMAKNLYETNSVFRHAFDQCAILLENNNDISLKEAIWKGSLEKEANNGKLTLNQTIYSQTAIFCVEYSLLKVWESLGVKPEYVLGHSVGEFAAATAAGIITVEEAISLVYERSQLIYRLPPGGMLAIRTKKECTEKLIATYEQDNTGEWIDIAAVNSEEEIVVAGKQETLIRFSDFCKEREIKTQVLAASHAFHSRDMEEMMYDFGVVANQVNYKSPKCNYVSGSTGQMLQPQNGINSKYWQNHARERVNFSAGIKTLEDKGCNVYIEIGAHPILLALSMSNVTANTIQNSLWLPSMRRNEEEWQTLLGSVSKLYINGFDFKWESLDTSFTREKLELPTYPFQRQKYWVEQSNGDSDGVTFCGKYIHPLLGSQIPLAGVNEHIFQHVWDLKNLSYLQDHQVANVIVLPGAGFLEVLLAAAKQCVPNSEEKFNIVLENFAVEAPLELETGKQYRIQIVKSADAENPEASIIKLFMYRNINGYNDEKGWKSYSSCKSLHNKAYDQGVKASINEIKERCPNESSTEEFYKKAPEIGIFFGPNFQSITKVWKGTNEILSEIPIPTSAGNITEYVFHPIVLDAMIQTFGYSIGEDKKELHLPVAVEKFEMFSDANVKSNYYLAHATWEEGTNKGAVKLYDEFGKIMCSMEGIKLVRTSVTSFLNVINSQKNKLPGMYQELWRARDGPLQSRVDLQSIPSYAKIQELLDKDMVEQMTRHEIIPEAFLQANRVISTYVLDVFKCIGWNPNVGDKFDSKSLMNDLIVTPVQESLFERLLMILAEDKYLAKNVDEECGVTNFEVIRQFPKESELSNLIYNEEENLNKVLVRAKEEVAEFPIAKYCMKCLPSVLLGKQTAVSALFSEGNDIDVFRVYTHGIGVDLANIRVSKFILNAFIKSSGGMLRILEVGAGSGATTNKVLTDLQKQSIPFRYTFTDISPHFLDAAKSKFKGINGIEYKILNIENDPKSQGFVPNHYDVIIAANVIHATENIRHASTNVRKLLAPGGIFVLQEMLQEIRHIDMIFGMLEGYWRFKDFDLRQSHPTINLEKWSKVLKDCGFTTTVNVSDPAEYTSVLVSTANNFQSYCSTIDLIAQPLKQKRWVMFNDEGVLHELLKEKLESIGENVYLITKESCTNTEDTSALLDSICSQVEIQGIIYLRGYVSDIQQENFCSCLLSLCKYFMKAKDVPFPTFYVVTKGIHYIGDQSCGNPANATMWGIMKSTKNERPDTNGKAIDLDPDNNDPYVDMMEVFSELWNTEDEPIIAFRNKKKYVVRISSIPNPPAPLTLPNQQRYTLVIPKTKAINDVTFRPMAKETLEKNFMEISVRACALNFRDILVILKPDMYHTLFEAVGTDFSGIVTDIGPEVTKYKVGDEVFGISNVTAVASHVVVPSDLCLSKPSHFTHAEASTLPSVFLTAYYCLFNVAKLTAGETILIHVASGGVGLIAIQLANLIGARVIATAGSKRKRAFLRSIGVKYVFHSRDTTYGAEIEKALNGKGVDMVLNSLTGPNFKETSLKACNKNARFVEMGKVNIWKPEEVTNLRPDVQYTIVDLERVQKAEMAGLFDRMDEIFRAGTVRPLEYTRFEVTQIKEALNYFLKAHHIGKIVVAMPEIQLSVGKIVSKDLLFNTQSTYLVTGGLGGIGFEVAKWMVTCGAKHVVLVGRSSPTEKVLSVLKTLNSKGANIMTMQVDVGDWNQCKNLFDTIKNPDLHLPPIRGVMHSAGALSDGILANQTWDKFKIVFNAKVNGGWNLHNLTKDLSLEHFVLFSSMAGIIGPMGQSNHAAANMFLDSLAHYRHSLGLPAQAINWGAWSEIGAAIHTAFGNEGLFGVKPFTPNQGLAALKFIMSRPFTQIGVVELDAAAFKESFGHIGSYLDELDTGTQTVSAQQSSAEAETFWAEIKELNEDQRVVYIKKHLETIIRQTLKLPESEVLDEHQTFSEMGLDSLMAVEMRNKLQLIFGKYVTLNATSLLDYPTLGGLSKYLTELTLKADLSSIDEPAEEVSSDEIRKMLIEDAILPAHITKADDDYIEPSKLQNILITGATGHVGVNLLCEILKIKPDAKIWCLLRGKTVENAKKRLMSTLKKFDLTKSIDIEKITIVLGNVAQENLSLSPEMYENLAKNIDLVVHCAAKVNHLEEYRKSKSFFDVRSVNVLGTLRILEFVSSFKTKHLVYPTSATAANVINENGFLAEECPTLDNNGDGINIKSGYVISKFISEKLIGQAIARGIPCVVLRYTSLVGHSQTGLFTLDTNWLMAACISFGQMGVMPNFSGGWHTIACDVACTLSCKLMFSDKRQCGLYNILQPNTMTSHEFASIVTDFGFNLKVIEVKEFAEKVKNEGENSMLAMFKDKFPVGDNIEALTGACPTFKLGLEKGQTIYCFSEKLAEIVPGFQSLIPLPKDTVRKQLVYAKKAGILKAAGLNV